jgi:hypothetical protein
MERTLEMSHIRLTGQTKARQFNTTLCRVSCGVHLIVDGRAPAISYLYTTVSCIVIIHSQVHVSTQMFYHARISVISYLFDRFVHVFQIRFKHFPNLGGNVYLTVDNNNTTDCRVEIRYRWCSTIDNKMYPTPQGLSLTFE